MIGRRMLASVALLQGAEGAAWLQGGVVAKPPLPPSISLQRCGLSGFRLPLGLGAMTPAGADCGWKLDGSVGAERLVLAQAVFLELAVEGAFADAQEFGGVFAVAGGEAEGFSDGAFFEEFEGGSGEGTGLAVAAGAVGGVVVRVVAFGADFVGDVADIDGGVGFGAGVAVVFAGGGDEHVLDDVEELADVAGPAEAGESHEGGVGDPGDGAAGEQALRGLGQGVHDDPGDVLAALAERREMNLGAFDAEEEVFAELLAADHGLEIFVGGADKADVGLAFVVAADADDLAGLEDAEELGLHLEGHIADFVEEECAAGAAGTVGGVFEDAFAVLFGPGEGAADVAEELIFEEGFGLGGAVECDEAAFSAGRVAMHGLRDEFLAGAALAGDEDGKVGGGDVLDGAENAAHRVGAGDDALEALVLDQVGVTLGFVAEEDGLGGAVDEVAEDLEVEGLFDEVVRAVFEGGAGGGHVAVGRDHDGLGLGLEEPGLAEDDEAGVATIGGDAVGVGGGGHAQVGDDDVEGAVA